jgi:hypothetical protein
MELIVISDNTFFKFLKKVFDFEDLEIFEIKNKLNENEFILFQWLNSGYFGKIQLLSYIYEEKIEKIKAKREEPTKKTSIESYFENLFEKAGYTNQKENIEEDLLFVREMIEFDNKDKEIVIISDNFNNNEILTIEKFVQGYLKKDEEFMNYFNNFNN